MVVRHDVPIEEWSPATRFEVGRGLADALRRDPDGAHATATGLAPRTGTGPGVRFVRYEAHLGSGRSVAYAATFPTIEPFLERLDAGDPGAIELGLEVLSLVEPEACVPFARALLAHEPWKGLGAALGRALGRCSSEESFTLLLDHPEVPYLRGGLAGNGYPGGAARAWASWRSDRSLPAAERLHAMKSEPVLAYLLRHDPEPAHEELLAVMDEHDTFAAHHFRNRGDERSTGILVRCVEATPVDARALSMRARFGLRALAERDPTTFIDAIGGLAHVLGPDGRLLRHAVVELLLDDVFRSRSRNEPVQGWLASIPEVPALLAAVRAGQDKNLARQASDLWKVLTPEAKKRAGSGPKAARKRPRPAPRAPDAALLANMEHIRAKLERLVAHLKKVGYRFVAPKAALNKPTAADARALERLAKRFDVPPVLAAFWSVVGSVDLRGDDPSWPVRANLELPGAREPVWLTDPLVVAPAAVVVRDALEEADNAPLPLVLAPDATGKAGYSGGQLRTWLSDSSTPDDAPIDGEPAFPQESLFAHVLRALDGGGMLGWHAIDAKPEGWITAARRAAIGSR